MKTKLVTVKNVDSFDKCNLRELKIGNMKSVCFLQRSSNRDTSALFMNLPEICDRFLVQLRDQIQKVFRCSSDTLLRIENQFERYDRPAFDGVKQAILMSPTVLKSEYINDFVLKYPNLISAQVETVLQRQPRDSSKIFDVKNLYLKWNNATKIFPRFTGRNAQFLTGRIEGKCVRDFLKKWVTGEAYQDLETLYIIGNVANRVHAFENLNTSQWNPSKRPKDFHYDPKLINYNPQSVDCSLYRDIESRSGKLASVYVGFTSVAFFVWPASVFV